MLTDPSISFCNSVHTQQRDTQTDRHTNMDIATERLNWPRGRLSENVLNIFSISQTSSYKSQTNFRTWLQLLCACLPVFQNQSEI